MSAPVSDPQRLTIPDNFTRGISMWVTDQGADPHEFSEAYIRRTLELGYAPDLVMCAERFVKEGSIA